MTKRDNLALARRRSNYTEVEIDAGLTAVAMASRKITQTGDPIALLKRLQQRHPNLVRIFEGSAEEITESDGSRNVG